MRLVWGTDLHLDFVDDAAIRVLGAAFRAERPDAVVVTGDTSSAPRLARHLRSLGDAVGCPLWFVLGNHDFYGGSIAEVRALAAGLPGWLPACGVVPLTPRAALVGVDGWGDARLGRWRDTPVWLNDFVHIRELAGLPRAAVIDAVRRLGDAEAEALRVLLTRALPAFDEVIVATHVPPFEAACWHDGRVSDADWLPWFTCAATGEALVEAARAWPDRSITVLCGHTHGAGVARVAERLVVRTGGADYGRPAVAGVVEVA
ncbi:MAG TPA: metallophosphoesterase [Myxococcota bacterium]|nr:metallophosphoesterase [Myxococcota bacterium]